MYSGIDVSNFNGNIDWDRTANDIDFAIEVIQTDKINVTYIMNLLRNVDTANKKQQAKDLEHIKQEVGGQAVLGRQAL